MYILLYVVILVIILTLIETISQYHLKLYDESSFVKYYIMGIFGYVIIATILAHTFMFEKMGLVNHIWNIGSSISVVLIGYLYFNEQLTVYQLLGVSFGVVGILLMGGVMNQKN